ncbi:MAG: hypothetical protein KG012_02950 [Deltaproteobacteria bacterium]|nr:hypothetical protein [Deltaproteobacteria bacterium]
MRWIVRMSARVVMLAMLSIGPMLFFVSRVESASLVKKNIIVADAETGDTANLIQGRKVKITCYYEFSDPLVILSPQKVQVYLDGKLVGTQAVESKIFDANPGKYVNLNYALTSLPVFWDAKAIGTNTVKCSFDPHSSLASAATTVERTFVVEATPVLKVGDVAAPALKSDTPVLPPGASAPKGPDPVATPGQSIDKRLIAKIAEPDLIILTANTTITPNCGMGQTVATLNVEVKNIGLGPVFTTPDKPLKLRVDADAGLVDQEVTVGALNPGQTLPLTVGLKPVGAPKSLAGAKLKLQVAVNSKYPTIEEANHNNNAVTIGLSFPANFCSSPAGAVRAIPTPAPGSGQPGAPSSPQLPAVQKPARPGEQKR